VLRDLLLYELVGFKAWAKWTAEKVDASLLPMPWSLDEDRLESEGLEEARSIDR
jgi:hypothetical protein